MSAEHINSIQWAEATGIARQSCARFFRDGKTASDAMRAFGLRAEGVGAADWVKAVEAIARTFCSARDRRAA